jgi:putative cardiolipin synthase
MQLISRFSGRGKMSGYNGKTSELGMIKSCGCMLTVLLLAIFAGCAALPPNDERSQSIAFTDTRQTTLGRAFTDDIAARPGQSGFFLLGNGLDAFVARAIMAQLAQRSVDTQYYMIHNDVVGSLFIDQLFKAAERGVRVRLLVDDIDQAGRDFGAAVLDSHPNIEVRIFNPFARNTGRTLQYVTGFNKQTRRAHNKSFTVDNQATILGGRNIGDEYFEADPELAFVDLDVLGVGPVAGQVSASFDQYWNSPLSYPVSVLVEKPPLPGEIKQRKQVFDEFISQQADSEYLQHLRESDLTKLLKHGRLVYHWGNGEVVADDPEKLTHDFKETQYHLSTALKPYFAGVKKELIIFSPYFVPGKSGVAFLKQLRDKGVRVRILTNSLSSTDVSLVHAGYARYRKALLRMGVELYELNKNLSGEERDEAAKGGLGRSKSSLHAKSFIMDRETVFIGSLNLDARSVIQNTEIGVIFDSPDIAVRLSDSFDQNIDKAAFRLELKTGVDGSEQILWHGLVDGKPQTLDVDPYTGFWKRVGIGFMQLLPIESQI